MKNYVVAYIVSVRDLRIYCMLYVYNFVMVCPGIGIGFKILGGQTFLKTYHSRVLL